MKVRVFSGIILLVFGAFITKFFMEDKELLTYYLSDRIPTQFTQASEQESLQIIELKNQGTKSIQRAILKINSAISYYEVNRVVQSDSIISNNSLQNLEVEYLKIPPTQKVSVIVKSLGKGITYDDLTVLHDNGVGIKESESRSNGVWIFWLFIAIYLFLFLKNIRESVQYNLASDLVYDPYDYILLKEKPLVTTQVP